VPRNWRPYAWLLGLLWALPLLVTVVGYAILPKHVTAERCEGIGLLGVTCPRQTRSYSLLLSHRTSSFPPGYWGSRCSPSSRRGGVNPGAAGRASRRSTTARIMARRLRALVHEDSNCYPLVGIWVKVGGPTGGGRTQSMRPPRRQCMALSDDIAI
jgi:hypothetical protein